MATSMSDMNYRIPTDVLHYEPRFFFGLSANDLLLTTIPTVIGMEFGGPVGGVIVAVLFLAGMKRFEGFGNRSAIVYLALMLWHKWRPSQVFMPRVLPRQEAHLEFQTFDGQTLFEMEVHK
jgi:hypothetical protein